MHPPCHIMRGIKKMPIYPSGKSNNNLQKSEMSLGTHTFLRFNMFRHNIGFLILLCSLG
jgi:hypothetical protein